MKNISAVLKIFIAGIAWLVFASGVILMAIGISEFAMLFSHLSSWNHHTASLIIIGLLHAVDLFLVAIVFFVMALGFFILFGDPDKLMTIRLPEWLRVKNFTQLKIILWEAILTTLMMSWLAGLAERKIKEQAIDFHNLVIPGGILILALSLFFLKKGEN